MSTRQNNKDDPLLTPLRATAPVEVLKAAKASLKEPTRPSTPGETNRKLFASDNYHNRPSSAFNAPNSRQFYDGGPKLALPRLEPLYGLNSDGSLRPPSRGNSGISDGRPGSSSGSRTSILGGRGSSTSSAAAPLDGEQLSSLSEPGLLSANSASSSILDGHLSDRPSSRRSSRDSSSRAPSLTARPSSSEEQLPPRPKSSRGRPGTAELIYSRLLPVGETNEPSLDNHTTHILDNDVQVLALSGHGEMSDAAELPGEDEALCAWRSEVELTLSTLLLPTDVSTSSSEKAAVILRRCTALHALLDYAREAGSAHGWLSMPSVSFVDAEGSQVAVRDAVGEHVFQLMDLGHPQLLLEACCMAFKVVHAKHAVHATAKMLYRLSKDASNDAYFRSQRLFDPIMEVITNELSGAEEGQWDILVYLTGALKNTSNDSSNQRALAKAGAISVLCAVLLQLASAVELHPTLLEAGAQVAVQVTGTLRNLAVSSSHVHLFLAGSALPAVRATLAFLGSQAEVATNISRILSKLSLHEGCQAAAEADSELAPQLLTLLQSHASNRAVVVRVAFVLGNFTTHSAAYRDAVAAVPGALDMLVATLGRYAAANGTEAAADRGLPQGGTGSGPASPTGSPAKPSDKLSKSSSREDCVVKLLRLLANLAINPAVGTTLAAMAPLAGSLRDLLQQYALDDAEELVLNCAATLTNLSYYQTKQSQVLAGDASQLLCHITPLLMCGNEEAVVEAARVYGNFSRSAAVRAYMVKARVVEALALLLDHSSSEVLYSVAGTLVNITADIVCKETFVQAGGVSRLIEVLEHCTLADPITDMEQLTANVVCKALFNLCAADDEVAQEGAKPRKASSQDITCFTVGESKALLRVLQHLQDHAELLQDSTGPVTERLLCLLPTSRHRPDPSQHAMAHLPPRGPAGHDMLALHD